MLNTLLPLMDAAPAASPAGGGSSMLIFILLMILIFYFFMIRPQQKKQKKIEEARNSLQKGDKVVTIGGFHGKITEVKEHTVMVSLAPDVEVELEKTALVQNASQVGGQ